MGDILQVHGVALVCPARAVCYLIERSRDGDRPLRANLLECDWMHLDAGEGPDERAERSHGATRLSNGYRRKRLLLLVVGALHAPAGSTFSAKTTTAMSSAHGSDPDPAATSTTMSPAQQPR